MFNNINFIIDGRIMYYIFMQFMMIMYPLKTYGEYKLGKIKFYHCIIAVILYLAFNYIYLSKYYR